jgi:hypothetical protein
MPRASAFSNSARTHFDRSASADHDSTAVSTVSSASLTLPGIESPGPDLPLVKPDVGSAEPHQGTESASKVLMRSVVRENMAPLWHFRRLTRRALVTAGFECRRNR